MGVILALAWRCHGLGGFQGGYFFDPTGHYTVSFANAVLPGPLNLPRAGVVFLTVRRRGALVA